MVFGYKFVELNDAQKTQRRELLEYYPFVAQVSVIGVVIVFWISRAVRTLAKGVPDPRKRHVEPVPTSKPPGRIARTYAKLQWWMKKPVVRNWGTRGEWIWGGLWMLWLLVLSAIQTGNDYLHLTKRFGIIGASQLPLHYLLAVRSPYSPLQLITRLSHEELKAAHQVLGRLIVSLFALHAGFYLNFFVASGFLERRIKDQDVIWGIISLVLFSVISTTALGPFRRWNYRLFYNAHVIIAGVVILSLWLHVTHIRPFIYQTLAVALLAGVLRLLASRRYQGSMKIIHGTNLLQVRIPLKPGDRALKWISGQHVYLSRSISKYAPQQNSNPFTVASIPAKDNELLLVARILNGKTKQLADWARLLSGDGSSETRNVTFLVEGPYGASLRLPDFPSFDQVLFIAGGVGATYIQPLYRTIVEAKDFNPEKPHVRFVWAARKLAETHWAFKIKEDVRAVRSPSPTSVEVFVTQPSGPNLRTLEAEDEFELDEDEGLLATEEELADKPRDGVAVQTGRPNIPAIVDEACSSTGKVAVFVCGPDRMSAEVSKAVERWVYKGRDIYFHNEAFGW